MEAIIAIAILGWFVGACFFLWDDLERLAKRMQKEEPWL